MLIGSFITATAFLDIFYLIKYIKKYKQMKMKVSQLISTKVIDVCEVQKSIRDMKETSKFYLIKGIMKTKKVQEDNNIFSIILNLPLNNNDPIMEHAYDKIPYSSIIKKASWRRPQQLKDINFDLTNMNAVKITPISVKGCQNTEISGALSSIFSFQIPLKKSNNKLLNFLRQIYDKVSNIYPLSFFKQQRITGQKIEYYAMLDDMFTIVGGTIDKKQALKSYQNNGYLELNSPQYIMKQVSFVLKKLKRKFNHYKIVLIFLISLQIYLLIIFAKWGYQRYLENLRDQQINRNAQNQEILPGQECIICYTSSRNVILKPCKHYGLCIKCYYHLKNNKCPICNTNIDGFISILKQV